MSEKDLINPSHYVMHGLEAEIANYCCNDVNATEQWYVKHRLNEIKIADPDDESSNVIITTTNPDPKLSERSY